MLVYQARQKTPLEQAVYQARQKTPLERALLKREWSRFRCLLMNEMFEENKKKVPSVMTLSQRHPDLLELLMTENAPLKTVELCLKYCPIDKFHPSIFPMSTEVLELLLNSGWNIIDWLNNGLSSPRICYCLNVENASLLIKHGWDVSKFYDRDNMILKNKPLLELLFSAGYRLDLFLASQKNLLKFLKASLEEGADVTILDYSGLNLLQQNAKVSTSTEIAEILISKGIDVNAIDKDGWNALFHFIFSNQNIYPGYIKLLIHSGININHQGLIDGNTVLHVALINNINVNIIKLLVQSGADILIKNKRGESPLDYAKRFAPHSRDILVNFSTEKCCEEDNFGKSARSVT